MPAQSTHEAITKVVLGKPYGDFHRMRDEGWQRGLIHRFQLRHSAIGDISEAISRKDVNIIAVGLLHDLADWSPLTVIDLIEGRYVD